MDMEIKKDFRANPNWVWGILLIGLGLLFLLDQLLPGFIGGLLWAAAFAVGGLVAYSYYMSHKDQWWALIPAYALWGIAGLIVLGSLRFIPGELIGASVMFYIAAPFFYVYLRDRQHWWALIPAYAMAALGVAILLSPILSGELAGSYVMFAIAAPFFYVYLRNRQYWWALIPGGIMAAIGMALLIAGFAYLVPALMVVAGVYLLVRHFSSRRTAPAQAAPPRGMPKTGPEADRPLPEFEPLGTRSSSPEADH